MKCTPEYRAYVAAKQRCTNPRDAKYPSYGGRGIQFRFVSFKQFITEIGVRPAGLVLDRIENDGHYEIGNVRWTTRSNSMKNRRPPTAEVIARRAATNRRRRHKRSPEFRRRMSEIKKAAAGQR